LQYVTFRQVDLDVARFEPARYDIICVFRYLNRDLFPNMRAALRPGGRIIYATFNEQYQARDPAFNPSYLVEIGELAGIFADWRTVFHDESGHWSRIVAVKP
jgi:SAM-dependent methyltransferase